MFSSIGGLELALIFLVILIFFGADKIPDLAKGLGKGMNEFKKASDTFKSEINKNKQSLYSSAPVKEEPKREKKEEAIDDKQEQSKEN